MAVDDANVFPGFLTPVANTTFLSKATDHFSHMLLQRWEAKIHQKEKLPKPWIELTTTRSWVRHAHQWARWGGKELKTLDCVVKSLIIKCVLLSTITCINCNICTPYQVFTLTSIPAGSNWLPSSRAIRHTTIFLDFFVSLSALPGDFNVERLLALPLSAVMTLDLCKVKTNCETLRGLLSHYSIYICFITLKKKALRKHCGKRWNCSKWAISPFPTMFSTQFVSTIL